MEDLWIGYGVSTVFAYIGVLVGAKLRGNKRGILGQLFLGVFGGFSAALLTLLLNMIGYDNGYDDNMLVGFIYGLIMENIELKGDSFI